MALSVEQLAKQLADSGIIAPGKLENFIPPKADPKTPEELVQALIKSENLTAFQGQQVKAGKAKALILGEYTILDKIGAGGMGQVFKSQHRRMKRIVAIKMLPSSMTKDAAALARFEREVEAAARLNHPNIVAAHDAGQANGAHFLVMEYVDGKDLSALVKQNGPLPVNKAVNYILQAARGLEFAHSEGVVHRDIKPANLLLDKKEVVKILDMGLARIEQADGGVQSELTGTGTIMGTVDYMSPEQALNTKYADQRADIYSLGISLYYLLAGKAAYSGDTAMEKLMAHQNQPIPSLQDVQTTVPKQLDAVFKKMVAKRIEDRYQTMSEVIEALEGLGYGGSSTGRKGDVASTLDLSSADRKKLLSQAKKMPLGSITNVVASEKSKNLILKIAGGSFGTIIAPILVFYLIRHLDKQEQPANPLAATAPAATVQHVAVATNNSPSPLAGEASGELRRTGPGVRESAPLVASGATGSAGASPATTNASSAPARVQPQVNATTATVPAEALTFNGHRYLLVESPGTWPEAKAKAEARGGHLATINSKEEHNWVTSILPEKLHEGAKGMAQRRTFIGGVRSTESSPWTWVTGEPFDNSLLPVNKADKQKGIYIVLVGQNRNDVLANVTTTYFLVEWDDPNKPAAGSGVSASTVEPQQAVKSKLAYLDPVFQNWVADTQKLPAEKQIEAVSKKLMELNPGFDGKVASPNDRKGSPKIENGVVTELRFYTMNVGDISPVRALAGLKALTCFGGLAVNSPLSDLSPLQGMKLTKLECIHTKISELSPLQGMPLETLKCDNTQVSDLAPLTDCKSLRFVSVKSAKVTPTQVTALQKALPNCKIEWDDPARQ